MATIVTRRTALRGLRCRACGALQPADERYVCADCYGPIEPEYDLASRSAQELRDEIESGPRSLWRYAALLPVAEPVSHYAVGWTPLHEAPRLGTAIGIGRVLLKDDSRNPSLSFKDRPVAMAVARALELGLDTLACASTGNLAGAVAAAAARNGLRAFVFVPATTDDEKVAGAAAYSSRGRVSSTRSRAASMRRSPPDARLSPTRCSMAIAWFGPCAIRRPLRVRWRSAHLPMETAQSRRSVKAAAPPRLSRTPTFSSA